MLQDVGVNRGMEAAAAASAAQVFVQPPSTSVQTLAAVAAAAAARDTGEPASQEQEQQQQQQAVAAEAGTTQTQQQLKHLQQQQQAWLQAWQQYQAPGSSGSGSSLGALLGQVSSGFPAVELPTADVLGTDQMLNSGWPAEPRLTDSRAASPLDLLGRIGHATLPQQQLSRQLSVPVGGVSHKQPMSGVSTSVYAVSPAATIISLANTGGKLTVSRHTLQLFIPSCTCFTLVTWLLHVLLACRHSMLPPASQVASDKQQAA